MDLRPPAVSSATIIHLNREGAIDDDECLKALEWVTKPISSARWTSYLRDWFLLLGLLLIVAGVVTFGAYNWRLLTRFQKFGLFEFLVFASWLAHWLRGLDTKVGQALLLSSSLLTGALLAAFGQVYQTGADSFQLFLGWAALILPWCLAGRLSLLWLVEIALLNLSLGLFWLQTYQATAAGYALASACLNLTFAWLWQRARVHRPWMMQEITGFLIAIALWTLSLVACISFWQGGLYLLCLLLTLALASLLARVFQKQASVLAIVCVALIPLSLSFMVWLLGPNYWSGNLLIIFVLILEVSLASRWLYRVHASSEPPFKRTDLDQKTTAAKTPLQVLAEHELLDLARPIENRRVMAEPPRYLGCLTVFGAWLTSWFILSFIFLVIDHSNSIMLGIGVVIWGISISASRSWAEFTSYGHQISLSFNIASFVLIFRSLEGARGWYISILALELMLTLLSLLAYKGRAGKTFFAFCLVPIGAALSAELAGSLAKGFDNTAVSLWLVLIASAISYLLLAPQADFRRRYSDVYQATTTGLSWGFFFTLPILTAAFTAAHELPILEVGFAVLLASCTLYLGTPLPGVVALLVFCLLTSATPGLSASVLFFVLAYHARGQAIWLVSVAGLLGFGVFHYYSLELSLAHKSLALLLSGIALLIAKGLLRSQADSEVGLAL